MDLSALSLHRNGIAASQASKAFAWIGDAFHRRSRGLIAFLDVRMETLISGWCVAVVALGLCKLLLSPIPLGGFAGAMVTLLPYLLIAFAPIAGYRVAAGSFPRGLLTAQPAVRLCRYGSWNRIDPVKARQNPSFGPTGFMASLLVGVLLNVPFRSVEFLMAIPAIAPGAPEWAHMLMFAMTSDVVVMNFFYMVCFVMALRAVPLFPRMMLFTWVVDILMQLIIAQQLAHAPGLPDQVALKLMTLLHGNIEKVLVSAFVWLPYLILSERVNVTFRQRVRA
jgi:hypothetical protein